MTRTPNDIIERAKKIGTPLIEGNTVTFVWQGTQTPQVMGDFSDWQRGKSLEMNQIAPDVWIYSRDFLEDAYIEYAFLVDGERAADPFNRRRIFNGINAYNHYFSMPAALSTNLVRLKPGVSAGKVTTITIPKNQDLVGKNRALYLYQPPVEQAVPLLTVLDGKDYYKRAKLTTIVDNLIAQKRIPPIAMAMLDNGGSSRYVEYFCSDATLGFLVQGVLEQAKQHLNLVDVSKQPGAYGILGASMGGLMAMYAGMRLPEVFGKVISQSGAFLFDFGGREMILFDLIREKARQPLKIWLDVGKYEWLLESNRKMKAVLEAKGYAPTYGEYSAGHNYTAWRNEVAFGLESVFA